MFHDYAQKKKKKKKENARARLRLGVTFGRIAMETWSRVPRAGNPPPLKVVVGFCHHHPSSLLRSNSSDYAILIDWLIQHRFNTGTGTVTFNRLPYAVRSLAIDAKNALSGLF